MAFEVVWDPAGIIVYRKSEMTVGENVIRTAPPPFKNPCEASEYLNKLANQSSGVLVPAERETFDLIRDLCRQSQPASQPPPAQPKPKATPTTKVPDKPTPPNQRETPDSLGAPDAPAAAVVGRQPTDTQVIGDRLADQHFDQYAPKPADQSIIVAAPPNATPEQLQDLTKQVLQNRPQPKEPHPNLAGEKARTSASDGEPVDLASGTFTIAVTDLEVPTATIPIQMVRRYRSGRPYFGPFGYGWDHSYNIYLRALKDGAMAMWTGELWESRFRTAGGGYKPQRGLPASLRRLAGFADVFEVRHPKGITWRFERPPGWTHAEHIPLTTIADRHGNIVKLTYDAASRLAGVSDEAGRGLRFTYGHCGLLERVTDHTGTRTVQYIHASEVEHLIRVILPPTAGHAKGIRTHYEYDATNPHPAMRHNILRISDTENRTYVENEYAGPEAGWAFNGVVRQVTGDFEFRFEYEPIQFVPANDAFKDIGACRTIVRPPDRSMHVHTFNYRGELLDHRFRLNQDRSGRVVATTLKYDEEGNLIETVGPDNLRTVRTFDSANPNPCARQNLLRVEVAAPVSGLMPSRTIFRASYDPVYQLPRVHRDETGARTRFVYDFNLGVANATGRARRIDLPRVTLPNGTTEQSRFLLEHNARGQVTAVTSPRGGRMEVDYVTGGPHDGFVHRIVDDASGERLTTEYTYNAAGYPASITAPGGRTTSLRYNALGLLEELTPPAANGAGSTTRQQFDDSGSLVRVERPRGACSDPMIQGLHIVDEYDRDAFGAVTHARLAGNTEHPREWRQICDWHGQPLVTWDMAGVRTRHYRDERGLLLRQRHGSSPPAEVRYAYDRAGRLERSVDAAGRMTKQSYDAWGRLQKVELPTDASRHFTWGARDRLLEAIVMWTEDPTEPPRPFQKTTYTYDERGRLLTETHWSFTTDVNTAAPLTTRFEYDADDNLTAITTPRGSRFEMKSDAMGRTALVTDEDGNTREMTYGPDGNLKQVTSTQPGAAGLETTERTYGYDARGRLATIDALGMARTFEYDDRDLVTVEKDPAGRITQLASGPHGELTARVRDAAGLAQLSRWEYDTTGNMNRFLDPTGEATRWPAGSPLSRAMELPDASSWGRRTLAAGKEQLQILPSGSTVKLTFGADPGSPVAMSCTAAAGVEPVSDHEFEYDGLGRLIRAANAAGEVVREYDSLNRVVSETANGLTVRTEFDDAAGTFDLVFPDGRRERTHLDVLGRPTRLELITPGALGGNAGDVLLEMSYSASGRPSTWTSGNGVKTAFAHDEGGRTIRVEHTLGANVVDACRVRYDAAGHRRLVQLAGAPGRTTLHTFDGLGRLVRAHIGGASAPLPDVSTGAAQATQIATAAASLAAAAPNDDFDLDLADARIERTVSGNTIAYTHGPGHVMTGAGAAAITYHPDGHRQGDARHTYDVDVLGRVVRIRDAATGAVQVEITYDALSRPASGVAGGVPFTRSFVGASWIEERGGLPAPVRQQSLHPFGGAPLLVLDSSSVRYIHQDDGLSTMCVTDGAGIVRERHRHDSFGVLTRLAADGATPVPFDIVEALWRGMPMVADTGLYATPRRLYDPELGVFLARDPLLYADSPSPYAFAGHNPADFVDPSGLSKTPIGRKTDGEEEHGDIWKWFHRQTRIWYWEPHYEGDILPQVGSMETGSLVLDYFANYQNSVYNMGATLINVPFRTLAGIDRLARNSRFGLDWQAANDLLIVERMPLFAAESVAYAGGWLTRARIMSRLTQVFKSQNLSVPITSVREALPVVRIHYTPHMAVEPGHANWMRVNLEWVMEEIGYFIKGDRKLMREDSRFRRLARQWLGKMMDLDGLQAGHPIDEAAGGMFRRPGEVGTTYYFMDENVNREFGRQLGAEQSRLGIRIGERFRIIFEGNWPSLLEHPPMAPPASPPNLGRP